MNDLIYNICITNLCKEDNLTPQQKKEYTKYLLNSFSHKKNVNALKDERYERIHLKISYKYANCIKKGEITEGNWREILKWIYDNRQDFLKNDVKDIYIVGSAYELLYPVEDRADHELEQEFQNDLQKFESAKEKGNENVLALVKQNAKDILEERKKIPNCAILQKYFNFVIEFYEGEKEGKTNENCTAIFLFFRLYCKRLISKNIIKASEDIDKFIPAIIYVTNSNFINNDNQENIILKNEVYKFLTFYFNDLLNFLKLIKYQKFNEIDSAVNNLVQKMVSLRDSDTFVKFLYGLNKYQPKKQSQQSEQLQQSEVYFRAASQLNYFKSMYFLSEIVKENDPQEALDLYDKIIEYNNSENNESKILNDQSDRLERACALYQKGLVYAEGLFSKSIDWEIVDQCWGDPDSDLCILKKDEICLKKYISTEYLNLQFVKYKANHGLLEAKHMYYMLCKKQNLTGENDILVIYMHELCMYSNYDLRYLEEFEEYARRLDVGEGVDKDKKKAKKIRQDIEEAKEKAKKNQAKD